MRAGQMQEWQISSPLWLTTLRACLTLAVFLGNWHALLFYSLLLDIPVRVAVIFARGMALMTGGLGFPWSPLLNRVAAQVPSPFAHRKVGGWLMSVFS